MKREDDETSDSNEAKPPAADNSSDVLVPPSPKRQRTSSPKVKAKGQATARVDSKASSATGSLKISPKQKGGGQSRGGGGRVRLPEKLLKLLNGEPMPDVVWWMPDGNGFAYNLERVQTEFLDKHFKGTKLTSFVRSLNRW